MIGVDTIGEIRLAYFDEHRPIKEIVRRRPVQFNCDAILSGLELVGP